MKSEELKNDGLSIVQKNIFPLSHLYTSVEGLPRDFQFLKKKEHIHPNTSIPREFYTENIIFSYP